MNFDITGALIVKENVVDISSSFRKREFVIEVVNERNTDWNDFVKFQLTQDKCALLDLFKLGDNIKVSFNIRGRKWEKDGKVNYFSNLEAWKLENASNSMQEMEPPPYAETDIPPDMDDGSLSDIPF
ncbi:MAG: DUF3127 domain-containing protein [Cytophagaceae bacterium]|jgi:hypothetical protein|nr:DUF3127 domain-containing protein [Cytophagaceae bacterium]